MAGTVCHKLNQALRLIKGLQNGLYHFQVGALIMPSDVIHLSLASLVDNQVNSLAVIRHMEPVAHILSRAVHRKLLICQGAADNKGNQLLREMIGAVVIGTPGHSHRQAVCPVICQHEQISACLGRGIRAGCVQGRFLCKEKVRSVKRQVAVHLIGGNLMIALDAIGTAGVKEGCGSHDIGPHKGLRVCNGTVHMALGGKVYHHIRLFLLKQLKYKLPVGNVALYKFIIGLVLNRL